MLVYGGPRISYVPFSRIFFRERRAEISLFCLNGRGEDDGVAFERVGHGERGWGDGGDGIGGGKEGKEGDKYLRVWRIAQTGGVKACLSRK